MLNKYIFMN